REKGTKGRGESLSDRSYYGCRDMAGNGLEWTAKVGSASQDDRRRVPLEQLPQFTIVYLRGRDYGEERPFRFEEVENPGVPYRAQAATHPTATIGFRVVLEPEQ